METVTFRKPLRKVTRRKLHNLIAPIAMIVALIFALTPVANAGFASDFNDIGGWPSNDLVLAIRWEFLQGVSGSSMAPDDPLTRAQFAVILRRVMALNATGSPTGFNDTSGSDANWWAPSVAALVVDGAIQPTDSEFSGGSFGPDQPITRGMVALWVERALQKVGVVAPSNGGTQFSDVDYSTSEGAGIQFCSRLGILKGFPDGKFDPNQTLTRGQAAAVADRAAITMPAGTTQANLDNILANKNQVTSIIRKAQKTTMEYLKTHGYSLDSWGSVDVGGGDRGSQIYGTVAVTRYISNDYDKTNYDFYWRKEGDGNWYVSGGWQGSRYIRTALPGYVPVSQPYYMAWPVTIN